MSTFSRTCGTLLAVGATFLTNHAYARACIARDADTRVRDIADRLGITERAAHRIVCDLVDEGYITRERTGRRNHYEVNPAQPLRHPLGDAHRVGDLLDLLLSDRPAVTGVGPSS